MLASRQTTRSGPPSTDEDLPAAPRRDRIALAAGSAIVGLVVAVTYVTASLTGTRTSLAMVTVAGTVAAFLLADRLPGAWVGVVGWAGICTAATAAALDLGSVGRPNLRVGMITAALLSLVTVVAWLRVTRRQGLSPAAAGGRAARVLGRPSTDLAPAVAASWMALPLIGSYGPYAPDADSSWLIASSRHVREDGIRLLQETHEVLLPYLTLSPAIALDGIRSAVVLMIVTVIGLAALVAYLGWKITGNGVAALAAPAALLAMPVMPERAGYLPMYATALLFAYGGGWLLHNAMKGPGLRPVLSVTAGIALVLGYEAHGVGQVFLVVPFLLLLLHPWRSARGPLAVTLAAMAVASVPRIAINLSIDGVTAFRSNRADFIVQQGYLNTINRDFHGQNVATSPLEYLGNLPRMADDAFGGFGLIVLVILLAAVAFRAADRRATVFCCAAAVVFVAMLAISSPAPYERYLIPALPGVAIVAAAGVTALIRSSTSPKNLGLAVTVTLIAVAFVQMGISVREKAAEHTAMAHGPLPTLATLVDDDRSVLGTRSHELAQVDPDVGVMFQRMMSEEDFVTFLSWPDDDEVIEMMDRLDIGWLLVRDDPVREIQYHQTWLEPAHGLRVNWVLRAVESDRFCLVTDAPGYWLYRLGECRSDDAGTSGLGGPDDPAFDDFRVEAGLPPLASDAETAER